jgi:transposase-like protein
MEFMREFPNDEACLQHVWRERFAPDGDDRTFCQRCEADRVFKRDETSQKRPCWFCQTCGFRIHPLVGTIFERSSTSLHLWFYAMYLITSTPCGISAKHLERELGVSYKTAWRMFNRIRMQLMQQDDEPLSAKLRLTRRTCADGCASPSGATRGGRRSPDEPPSRGHRDRLRGCGARRTCPRDDHPR